MYKNKSKTGKYTELCFFAKEHFGIRGYELAVYAIIFSLYWNKCEYFYGSREYLANAIGSCVRTVDYALTSLVKKGLILKKTDARNDVKRAVYMISIDALPDIPMFKNETRHKKNTAIIEASRARSGLEQQRNNQC